MSCCCRPEQNTHLTASLFFLQARSISNIQQNRVVLNELDPWTKYCVQVQILTERNPSNPSAVVCESTTKGKHLLLDFYLFISFTCDFHHHLKGFDLKVITLLTSTGLAEPFLQTSMSHKQSPDFSSSATMRFTLLAPSEMLTMLTTIGWIEFCSDIHFPPPPAVPLVPSSGHIFNLPHTLVYDQTPAELMTFPSASLCVTLCLMLINTC